MKKHQENSVKTSSSRSLAHSLSGFASLALVALSACSGGDPDTLLRPSGGPSGTAPPGTDPTQPGGGGEPPPVVLECTEKPPGRTYKGFDGVALELELARIWA